MGNETRIAKVCKDIPIWVSSAEPVECSGGWGKSRSKDNDMMW